MLQTLSLRWPLLISRLLALLDAGRQQEDSAQWVRNARAERLLTEHGNAVLRLAYSYLHSREDAEEVLQDTMTQLLRTDPQFANEAHEKAWLLRVAANLSISRIRAGRRHPTDELKEELAAENRQDLAFVWDAVRSLPDSCRGVIHLFYQEGYTTGEIAQILGLKETTVRVRLTRGRQQLRKVLKEEYDLA